MAIRIAIESTKLNAMSFNNTDTLYLDLSAHHKSRKGRSTRVVISPPTIKPTIIELPNKDSHSLSVVGSLHMY